MTLLPGQGQEGYKNLIQFLGWMADVREEQSEKGTTKSEKLVGYAEVAVQLAVGLGVMEKIVEEKKEEGNYETELAELDRLLEEEEIGKKGYEKRLGELKAKWGR